METNEPSGDQKFNAVDDITTSMSRLLQKKFFTDVEFHVVDGTSTKVLPAHKLILACRSPILADRFYKEKNTSAILESSVGPLGIEQMIRYIYLDDIGMYSASALKGGLEASLKYGIKPLENLCISGFMDLKITGDNVYEVLDAANRVKHDGIRQRCLEIIRSDSETVLNSSAFRRASLDTLLFIFQLPELNTDGEGRLLEAAIVWLQHNPNSSARHKLLSCIDLMALSVDEFLTLVEKFPTFFTDSEIVSIISNIRHFRSRHLPEFCIAHNIRRKFLKPKCKTNVISNIGISNDGTQTSDFIMLDKSTQISQSERYLFSNHRTACVQTSLHATLEKSTEISVEEHCKFHKKEFITAGTQTIVVSTLDGNFQIPKSEAFMFNRKQTTDKEVQTTSTTTSNRSIQTSNRILKLNQNTQVCKNDFDMFMSSETYDTEVQSTFFSATQQSSPVLDPGTYNFHKNENDNTHISRPSVSKENQANAKRKASSYVSDERIRINFENQSRDLVSPSKQISSKIRDSVSAFNKEDISDKTSSEIDPDNRIRISLIGDPSKEMELKIKFTVYDGTEIQELITYYTLLKESSTFFAQLFSDDHYLMKLANVKLDDLSFTGLSYMIRFIEEYRMTVKRLADFPKIWKVACRFGMDELQKYCENHVENVPITTDTVDEVMYTALRMELRDIHKKCKTFISRRFNQGSHPMFTLRETTGRKKI